MLQKLCHRESIFVHTKKESERENVKSLMKPLPHPLAAISNTNTMRAYGKIHTHFCCFALSRTYYVALGPRGTKRSIWGHRRSIFETSAENVRLGIEKYRWLCDNFFPWTCFFCSKLDLYTEAGSYI